MAKMNGLASWIFESNVQNLESGSRNPSRVATDGCVERRRSAQAGETIRSWIAQALMRTMS
jgi:hypothetical protein